MQKKYFVSDDIAAVHAAASRLLAETVPLVITLNGIRLGKCDARVILSMADQARAAHAKLAEQPVFHGTEFKKEKTPIPERRLRVLLERLESAGIIAPGVEGDIVLEHLAAGGHAGFGAYLADGVEEINRLIVELRSIAQYHITKVTGVKIAGIVEGNKENSPLPTAMALITLTQMMFNKTNIWSLLMMEYNIMENRGHSLTLPYPEQQQVELQEAA